MRHHLRTSLETVESLEHSVGTSVDVYALEIHTAAGVYHSRPTKRRAEVARAIERIGQAQVAARSTQ